MSTLIQCDQCGIEFGPMLTRCPHCERPALYPNVRRADRLEQIAALTRRYEDQVQQARAEKREVALRDFENKVKSSTACKAMRRWEIDRLISSDGQLAATYYQQIAGNSRLPDNNKWDRLRRIADAAFLESYGSIIHFAALSTNGTWPKNYGDGAVFFKENMIKHRASLFEENTAKWVEDSTGTMTIPAGSMASWDNRHMLAVAKLGSQIGTTGVDQDDLLLHCGSTSQDDSFMEVHICFGFSIRSVEALVIKEGTLCPAAIQCLEERVARREINYQVVA